LLQHVSVYINHHQGALRLCFAEVTMSTLLTYLLTYLLLTPWCRVLLQNLTGLQLVKKFPAFHGTRRFITALTSVRHLSLSWASPIQSIYPHLTSWRSILILSTHPRLVDFGYISLFEVIVIVVAYAATIPINSNNVSGGVHHLSFFQKCYEM